MTFLTFSFISDMYRSSKGLDFYDTLNNLDKRLKKLENEINEHPYKYNNDLMKIIK